MTPEDVADSALSRGKRLWGMLPTALRPPCIDFVFVDNPARATSSCHWLFGLEASQSNADLSSGNLTDRLYSPM